MQAKCHEEIPRNKRSGSLGICCDVGVFHILNLNSCHDASLSPNWSRWSICNSMGMSANHMSMNAVIKLERVVSMCFFFCIIYVLFYKLPMRDWLDICRTTARKRKRRHQKRSTRCGKRFQTMCSHKGLPENKRSGSLRICCFNLCFSNFFKITAKTRVALSSLKMGFLPTFLAAQLARLDRHHHLSPHHRHHGQSMLWGQARQGPSQIDTSAGHPRGRKT